MSVHQALLFHQLSRQGTVLQNTGPALSEEQLVEADAGGLTWLRLSDGTACSLMR